jgi:hypothetical protein
VNKKYTVQVLRTAYAILEIEVEAKNQKEAKQKAVDEAGNMMYSEFDADYSIQSIKSE